MAKRVKTEYGTMLMLTKEEQAAVWKELDVDVSPVGKNIPQYTPSDKLEYFIISETETSYDKFTCVVSVKGKEYSFKCNICNMDKKYNETVRKAYAA